MREALQARGAGGTGGGVSPRRRRGELGVVEAGGAQGTVAGAEQRAEGAGAARRGLVGRDGRAGMSLWDAFGLELDTSHTCLWTRRARPASPSASSPWG